MTSTLQPALAAWDGISQKLSETEGLLASKPGAPRYTWQRNVALLLLGIVTALSLVLCGVVWQITVKFDRLSRSIGAGAAALPATELNAFPLLVSSAAISTQRWTAITCLQLSQRRAQPAHTQITAGGQQQTLVQLAWHHFCRRQLM